MCGVFMYVAYRHNILALVRIPLIQKGVEFALCGLFLFGRHQNCVLLALKLVSASIDDAFQLTNEILVALDVRLMLCDLKFPLGQLFAKSLVEGISMAAHCRAFDALTIFETNCDNGFLVRLTLPTAKAGGFLVRPSPLASKSYMMSPSV